MKNNIGIGITTFNRPDYARQCLQSLIKNDFGGATIKYMIDDCSKEEHNEEYKEVFQLAEDNGVTVLRNKVNRGVGVSKNILLKRMMADGCEHLFLMEDDILMKKDDVCNQYITCADIYDVQHMNFALHGTMNVGRGFSYNGMMCYPNIVGAFSYHTREVVEKVGYMDEQFQNAFEHVEYCYRIINAGYTTPFWKFVDHPHSAELLEEIPGSIDSSSIRPLDNWQSNIAKAKTYWVKKYNTWLPPRD